MTNPPTSAGAHDGLPDHRQTPTRVVPSQSLEPTTGSLNEEHGLTKSPPNEDSGNPQVPLASACQSNELSSLGGLQTCEVAGWSASIERPTNSPPALPVQAESVFQPYEGEGWCDEMVELSRANPRPAPQGPAAPVTGSLWVRFKPHREATIVSADHRFTYYRLGTGSPTLTLPTKRFVEIYKPI